MILVGDIRDKPTDHATTVAGVLTRLRAFDGDLLTMAETLVTIVSQRLVRTSCPNSTGKARNEMIRQDVLRVPQISLFQAVIEPAYALPDDLSANKQARVSVVDTPLFFYDWALWDFRFMSGFCK